MTVRYFEGRGEVLRARAPIDLRQFEVFVAGHWKAYPAAEIQRIVEVEEVSAARAYQIIHVKKTALEMGARASTVPVSPSGLDYTGRSRIDGQRSRLAELFYDRIGQFPATPALARRAVDLLAHNPIPADELADALPGDLVWLFRMNQEVAAFALQPDGTFGQRYNPNHGEGGKFASAAGGSAAPKKLVEPHETPAVREVEKSYPPANPAGRYTNERHLDAAGNPITPERTALHAKLEGEHLDHVSPATGEKTMVFMGGGPASGKSSILKSGAVELERDRVHIDSDAIKLGAKAENGAPFTSGIPEAKALVEAVDFRAASFVHEESSIIGKHVMAKAYERGMHVVLDGTGDGSVDKMVKCIDDARKLGYKVKAEYTTCDANAALQRNWLRAEDQGRLPPENMLTDTHESVSKILPTLAEGKHFDSVRLWDTSLNNSPRLVMSGDRSGMKVHDHELWKTFKEKASNPPKYNYHTDEEVAALAARVKKKRGLAE